MKTKEEVLKDNKSSSTELTARQESDALYAMQEYADQQTKELKKDIVRYTSLNLEYLNQIKELREEIERLKDKIRNFEHPF